MTIQSDMTAQSKDNLTEITLPSVLDLQAAQSFREELLEALACDYSVVVRADMVENITTPCIQLILAADRALRERDLQLRVVAPSEQMREAFATIGIDLAQFEEAA